MNKLGLALFFGAVPALLLAQQNTALTFRPVDAEYSALLDRIILISASPNQIHIYNPLSKTAVSLNLAAAPNVVSVSPNGRYAAVGHQNLLSYVDVQNTTIVKTIPVTNLNVTDLVLAADYIYIPPGMAVRISDGAITNPVTYSSNYRSRLGPDGAIYTAGGGSLSRTPVSGTTFGSSSQVSTCYASGLAAPKPSMAGGLVYDGCGTAFSTGTFLAYSHELAGPSPDVLVGSNGLAALAVNVSRGVAAIPNKVYSLPVPVDDNEVYLYGNSSTTALSGKYVIADYLTNGRSYPAHARWAFFDNAGTNLYVIHQADGTAGLLNDFALYSAALPGPAAGCGTSLSSNAAALPAEGGVFTASVTSAANCAFQASTSTSWIVPHAPNGAGSVTLRFLARPNLTGSQRTGTITIGTETLTVTQAAYTALPALQLVGYRVRQAAYSQSRERLLLTSAYPNELHIYDPITRADTIVALPFVPTALSLTPDGATAAVGGDGVVAFATLSNGNLTVPARTKMKVQSLALPGNGYAHVFGTRGPVTTIHIATGAAQDTTTYNVGPVRLVPPANRYAYARGDYYYATKWDFGAAGVAGLLGNVGSSSSGFCLGENFWLSEEGTRVFAQCGGRVFRTSDVLSADLSLNGDFGGMFSSNGVEWVAHSAANRTIAVAARVYYYSSAIDNVIHLFGDESFSYLGKASLPEVDISGTSRPLNARFLFWNSTADRLIAVTAPNPETSLDYWGVYTLGAANNCATLGSGGTSAAFGIEGGSGQVAVTASCPWRASSNAAWLTITAGGFGVGSASLGYAVSRNDSGAARTATISFGNQSFTVTQSTGSISLTPGAASAAAVGVTGSIAVSTTPAGVGWTALTTTPWLQITSGASGSGAGAVGYRVLPNATTASRTGTITVGGVVFTVTQGGAGSAVSLGNTYFYLKGEGDTGSTTVIATGTWIAVANDPWIRITAPAGGVGSGNGTLSFSVDPNPNPAARSGTITINGQPISVNQYEPPARVTFSPDPINVGAAGGTGTVTVTSTSPNYYWSAYSNASWASASGSRSGSGTFTYSVSANTSTAARTATIYVGTFLLQLNQAGAAPPPPPLSTTGLHFVPVTPCRIADTREATRASGFGTPALASGVARSFAVPNAPGCGIPSTAKAYSMNVTVVPKGPLGYITIWPTGAAQPFVSTLNSIDGRVKANAAIVPAGSGGAVSVMATDATELVLDINGYFIEPGVNAGGLAFYPVTPCRIADTRTAAGSLGGPIIAAGGVRNFPVRSAGCGIPSTALAYSMNATVVPAAALGYISMWPTGQAQPFVSTLNAPTGAIVANAAIVPAGSSGEVSVFAQGQTHLVLDINGYFALPGQPDAQKFYPIVPCRIADTREAAGDFGGPALSPSSNPARSFPVRASNCGFPSTARAYSLNATVVPPGVLGYLTLWATGQAQPFVSTLNVTDDKVVANAAIVPAGTGGAVSAVVTNATHLVLDTNGYFAP